MTKRWIREGDKQAAVLTTYCLRCPWKKEEIIR